MLRCTEVNGLSAGPGSTIRDGDELIVYLYQDEMRAVIVDSKSNFNCRFGNFKMQVIAMRHVTSCTSRCQHGAEFKISRLGIKKSGLSESIAIMRFSIR